jgi:hypothetical protein
MIVERMEIHIHEPTELEAAIPVFAKGCFVCHVAGDEPLSGILQFLPTAVLPNRLATPVAGKVWRTTHSLSVWPGQS